MKAKSKSVARNKPVPKRKPPEAQTEAPPSAAAAKAQPGICPARFL